MNKKGEAQKEHSTGSFVNEKDTKASGKNGNYMYIDGPQIITQEKEIRSSYQRKDNTKESNFIQEKGL